jgi:hypothetical protein
VPTTSGKTQAKRPRTAKELRAVRRRRREREKRERKEQGIRPIWSLPAGQPERRNSALLRFLMCPVLGAAIGWRLTRMGLPTPGPIILGVVVWILFTAYVTWSSHKAFPR